MQILLLQILRGEQEVNVVHPNHLLFPLELEEVLHESLVDLAVSLPQVIVANVFELVLARVGIDLPRAFEVVDCWLHVKLIEQDESVGNILVKPHGNALLLGKQLSNLCLLLLILGEEAGPPHPLEVDHSLGFESEDDWV